MLVSKQKGIKSTTLCSASYVGCQSDAARIWCSRRAVQQPIDISYLRSAQQQTRCKPLLLSIDGTDGQTVMTDGRTDGRSTVSKTLLRILCRQRPEVLMEFLRQNTQNAASLKFEHTNKTLVIIISRVLQSV